MLRPNVEQLVKFIENHCHKVISYTSDTITVEEVWGKAGVFDFEHVTLPANLADVKNWLGY